MIEEIDLLVGIYGPHGGIEPLVAAFLSNLREKCTLDGVKVTCVERLCSPVSFELKDMIIASGCIVKSCPLPPADNSREDASLFTNWMIDNCGNRPWVAISHFDLMFTGDYFSYVRGLMPAADMIGEHHDGMVLVRRDAYRRCGVGFHGVDNLRMVKAGSDVRVVPMTAPGADHGQYVLSLDVGELLSLRMCALGLRHLRHWRNGYDDGKSHYFVHTRRGSGHGGVMGDGDA